MINISILEGILDEVSEIKETPSGVKYASILIDVKRPFKNGEGIYESDKMNVTVWKSTAEHVCEKSKKGDRVCIRAHIQTYSVKKENQTYYNYEIVADHVSLPEE